MQKELQTTDLTPKRLVAYAKINWSLRVTGKRADGYHELETVFQTISLHDELTLTTADRLSLACDDPSIPTDDSNLILRAARAVGAPPMHIRLDKRIPAGGGLGGGSADAAAVLQAFGGNAEIALSLGSDVPFFLIGGTAYATGRGEKLVPMPPVPPTALLLVLPRERVSTAEAFSLIKRYSKPLGLDAYRDLRPDVLVNDFEEPIFRRLPHLAEYKERLLAAGAFWAAMTGSGSTIVGAFPSPARRDAARIAFEAAVATVAAETINALPPADAMAR